MSGIERERVVNKDILELFGDYINCIVCRMIIKDPFTCEKCEASCCKKCFNSEFTCKRCHSNQIKFFPSVFKNFLFVLKIKCKFCENTQDYNKIEEHENICFETVNPPNCLNGIEHESKYSLLDDPNLEVSQEITQSFVKLECKEEEKCTKNENNLMGSYDYKSNLQNHVDGNNIKLLNELKGDFSKKDINDINDINMFNQENIEDKHSDVYSNFMDSILTNNIKSIKDSQVILPQLKIEGDEKQKDYEIRALSVRVSNLENLCATLINEVQNMRNTYKMLYSNPSTNYITTNISKIPIYSQNVNMMNQKEMIVFNSCFICAKITNVKIQLNCINCEKNVCPECNFECRKCGEVSCKSCGSCSLCKEIKYCYKCKYSCDQCIKNRNVFGEECIKSCEVCEKENKFCKRCCGFKCKECSKISCLKCLWNCKICFLSFCVNHPNDDCKICGITQCNKCSKKCVDCERLICNNCFIECKKCNNNVCKSCCINLVKEKMKTCKKCLK